MPVTNDRDPRQWPLERLCDALSSGETYDPHHKEAVRRLREQAAQLAAVEALCRERISPGCGCDGCNTLTDILRILHPTPAKEVPT